MLIIRKITHKKNSFNRKLQLPFEVFNLCKLMIVKEFDYSRTHNIKTCEKYTLDVTTTQKLANTPFNNSNFARVDKTQKPT